MIISHVRTLTLKQLSNLVKVTAKSELNSTSSLLTKTV